MSWPLTLSVFAPERTHLEHHNDFACCLHSSEARLFIDIRTKRTESERRRRDVAGPGHAALLGFVERGKQVHGDPRMRFVLVARHQGAAPYSSCRCARRLRHRRAPRSARPARQARSRRYRRRDSLGGLAPRTLVKGESRVPKCLDNDNRGSSVNADSGTTAHCAGTTRFVASISMYIKFAKIQRYTNAPDIGRKRSKRTECCSARGHSRWREPLNSRTR
jgi:hypothetical protein